MTDANIEYIWGFLKLCHERGWLYKGHRSMPWCPRCGTSLSQHELMHDSYARSTHPSLFVRLPLEGRDREYLLVWTTTPWTLPANVAAAVHPDADYARVETASGTALRGGAAAEGRAGQGQSCWARSRAPSWSACATAGRSTSFPPWRAWSTGGRLGRRREEEGTGIVHIAPGCGAEDFELGQARGPGRRSCPIDEAGASTEGFGGCTGKHTADAAQQIFEDLRQKGRLVHGRASITHRYPVLLALRHRAGVPAGRRVVHPLRRDPPSR